MTRLCPLPIALLVSIVVAMPVAAATTGPTWVTTIASETGFDPSLVIDATGRRHLAIAQLDGSIVYLTTTTGAWARTIVGKGRSPSLAVDGHGKVHIAYLATDVNGWALWYATNRSGAWTTHRVSGAAQGSLPSIAVDSEGEAHVAFGMSDDGFAVNGIGYATNRRGFWIVRRMTTDTVSQPSIALDSDRHVHIAYASVSGSSAVGIQYLTNVTGAWTSKRLSTTNDSHPSIVALAGGKVAVAYAGHNPTTLAAQLRYETNVTGSWVITVVPGGTDSPSLAVAGGVAAIASSAGTSGITMSTNAGATWKSSSVSRYFQDIAPDVGFDPSGTPVVAYANAPYDCSGCGDGGVFIAARGGPSWTVATVNTGQYITAYDLAVDANGKDHVIWPNPFTPNELDYATNATGTWVTTPASVDPGSVPSIAVDSLGKAHIAFVRSGVAPGSTDIWYATNATGSWVETLVAAGENWCPRISLDGSNHAWIVYPDGSTGAIRYVTNSTGSWSAPANVGSALGGCPDGTVDAAGHLHVAYRDNTTGRVRYATNATGSFVLTTLPGGVADGGQTPVVRLALDGNGKVHVAWLDATDLASEFVSYATNASGSWVTTGRSDIVTHVLLQSLAVTPTGVVHVFGYDNAVLDMSRSGGRWQRDEVAVGGGAVGRALADGTVHVLYGSGGLIEAHD